MSRLEAVKRDLSQYKELLDQMGLQPIRGHVELLRRHLEPKNYGKSERDAAKRYFEHFRKSKEGLTREEIAELSLEAFATIAMFKMSGDSANENDIEFFSKLFQPKRQEKTNHD